MKLKTTLIIFLFLYFKATAADKIYFSVVKEGIHKIKIPKKLKGEAFFLSCKEFSYEVIKDREYLFFYCPKPGIYQISTVLNVAMNFKLNTNIIFDKKTFINTLYQIR